MTFKETDFPGLLKSLKTLIAEEKDPNLVRAVVEQLIKMYEDIPLYPGIANMCFKGVTKAIDPKTLTTGQKVFIRNGDDFYFGTVVRKGSDGVSLKNAKAVTSEDELEVDFKEMDRITVINDKILDETWPSLVFEKEKKR